MFRADPFFAQAISDVLGKFIGSQPAGIMARSAYSRGGHERRAGQPSSLPLAAQDLRFTVGRGILLHVKQVIDGDTT
jgi:hypothetical protein